MAAKKSVVLPPREGYRAAVTESALGYAGTPEILALELRDLFGGSC